MRRSRPGGKMRKRSRLEEQKEEVEKECRERGSGGAAAPPLFSCRLEELAAQPGCQKAEERRRRRSKTTPREE